MKARNGWIAAGLAVALHTTTAAAQKASRADFLGTWTVVRTVDVRWNVVDSFTFLDDSTYTLKEQSSDNDKIVKTDNRAWIGKWRVSNDTLWTTPEKLVGFDGDTLPLKSSATTPVKVKFPDKNQIVFHEFARGYNVAFARETTSP